MASWETEYANFHQRATAFVIDWLIFFAATWVITQTLVSIIGAVYFIGLWAWPGQTLGKMALGLYVVKADGSHIGLGRAILRYINWGVSFLILFVGHLWIAWDAKSQGLHDKFSGTFVVKPVRLSTGEDLKLQEVPLVEGKESYGESRPYDSSGVG